MPVSHYNNSQGPESKCSCTTFMIATGTAECRKEDGVDVIGYEREDEG
jgi:hypothetical protein